MIAANDYHQSPVCLCLRERFGGTMELKLLRATNIPLSRTTRAGELSSLVIARLKLVSYLTRMDGKGRYFLYSMGQKVAE